MGFRYAASERILWFSPHHEEVVSPIAEIEYIATSSTWDCRIHVADLEAIHAIHDYTMMGYSSWPPEKYEHVTML